MKSNNSIRRVTIASHTAALCIAILLTACSETNNQTHPDSDTAAAIPQEEVFHANNDIAMTVSSIMDAISQNEPLDTAAYNFEGVLTDGSGAALYINDLGMPGTWRVKVDEDKAQIENLDLGSFSPDNVRQYVCAEVGLTEEDIVRKGEIKGQGRLDMTNYVFKGGEIHFESSKAKTADGKEGPILAILILKTPDEAPDAARADVRKQQ